MDAFTGDINSVDKLEIDIDYNVDMIWHEDWVYKMCQDEALNTKGYGPKGNTLWSKDGFRGTQVSAEFNKTPSVI
jgi:hypothetical protein